MPKSHRSPRSPSDPTDPFLSGVSSWFNNEFEAFDGDDNNHAATASILNLPGYNPLESATFANPKALLSGAEQQQQPGQVNPAVTSVPDYSPLPSHRGSSSSSSSQRSADSNSLKTSQTSADAMVTDDPFFPWNENDSNNFMFDNMEAGPMDYSNFLDFESASSSPSPPVVHGLPTDASMAGNPVSEGPVAKRMKGHHKAQSQHSLTTSMNGLKTSASREVSPSSNLVMSQESSPTAMMTNSPSPDNNGNFFKNFTLGGLGAPAVWSPVADLQAGNSAPQARQDPTSMPVQARSLPAYSPQAGLAQVPPPRLVVHSTPLKSRVETQIPIKLTIHNLPDGIKRVHLPTHTISKPKLLAKPPTGRSPDMLELYTMLVCTSAMQDPSKREQALKRAALARHDMLLNRPDDSPGNEPQNGGEVRICDNCITRERKRAGRKKHKKPEEEELWNRFEHQRVIVFNTQEVKEWQAVTPIMVDPTGAGLRDLSVPDGTVQVDAPMRIACYCRHHQEKAGFQVIFTLKDYRDTVVAQQMSSSIMITDDHKTHIPAASTTQVTDGTATMGAPQPSMVPNDKSSAEPPSSFRQSQSNHDVQGLGQNGTFGFPPTSAMGNPQMTPVTSTPRNMSRQGSPTMATGSLPKKRKASGSVKLPNGLAMTKLETGQPLSTLPPGVQNGSAIASAVTSPFSPNMANFPLKNEPLYSHGQQPPLNNMAQPFTTGPPTPNSNGAEQLIFPSGNNMPVSQLFSAPTSAHPSRAPSPTHLHNELQNMAHPQLNQALYNGAIGISSARLPPPMIYKIIPSEGPKSGGVEVTILGSGFTNGLEVMFGDLKAATTTFWGETSLVCLLPPSPSARVVPVSIKQPSGSSQHPFSANQQPLFRYIDDDEHQLIRNALTVLNHKLGGPMQDVTDVARNIIYGGSAGSASWGLSPSGGGGQAPGGNFNNLEQELSDSLEAGLVRVLELIDLDDSANKARINLRRSTGQTMLHLACSLGLVRFVAGLLSRGANVCIRDKGGFTPLHMAAMNNHPEIVRRLIMKGADPNMRSLSGLTSADVARSTDVLRVLRRIESHSRSRSGGSLHSRVSSANSLRSLWDPPTMSAHREEFMSDSPSSSEDSTDDNNSSEEVNSDAEDQNWLSMRRPNYPPIHHKPEVAPLQSTEVVGAPASPGAAVTAIRDQFTTQLQQWHNSVAMHIHNLPQLQMPHIPQMQMPMSMPDYQAYLHSGPVMQRISSLVPNIRGARPNSSGSQSGDQPSNGQPSPGADNKWWDLSLFGAKEPPPPAYEDIYPHQKDLDTKQASAAQAAAEFEADSKCAALFDQPTATAEASTKASTSQEAPAFLQIGRKHHITKEQQENLQRAHAQSLKTGSSDKMLWFVWIPILVFILGAMLFSGAPQLTSNAVELFKSSAAFVVKSRAYAERLVPNVQQII
ncbi:hypothetical protein F5B20DRAFT_357122 [Whalleya microplaca]|nr:hypothetical protein F5B20DRAFT_357122 [Whalleya microplaca]